MESKKLFLSCALTTLALSLATLNANAATGPIDANALWSGVYMGAYFGAGAGDALTNSTETSSSLFMSQSLTSLAATTQVSNDISSYKLHGDTTGSIADLFVGFNYHPDCAVYLLGLQLEGSIFSDVTYKTVGDSASTGLTSITSVSTGGVATTAYSTTAGTSTSNFYDELTSLFKLVARGGYIIDPSTMVYILGGGVAGHFVIPDDADFTGGKRNKWVGGYTVGAGLEYMFNEHWSLRGEYRYLNFDYTRSQPSTGSSTSATASTLTTSSSTFNRSTRVDFDDNLAEIGIVYRLS